MRKNQENLYFETLMIPLELVYTKGDREFKYICTLVSDFVNCLFFLNQPLSKVPVFVCIQPVDVERAER